VWSWQNPMRRRKKARERRAGGLRDAGSSGPMDAATSPIGCFCCYPLNTSRARHHRAICDALAAAHYRFPNGPWASSTAHDTTFWHGPGTARRPVQCMGRRPGPWHGTGTARPRERHGGRHGRQAGTIAAPTALLAVARWPNPHCPPSI
jgi:hypothetical protein